MSLKDIRVSLLGTAAIVSTSLLFTCSFAFAADISDFRENLSNSVIAPVQSKVAGFTLEQVAEYGKLAQLAYVDVGQSNSEKLSEIENLQSKGAKVNFFGSGFENSGIIVEHPDGRVTLSYKGSNSSRNVLTDLWANFAIDDNTGLRCHQGIMEEFYVINKHVTPILEQIAAKKHKSVAQLLQDDVTVTGHSLGGGLAAMFVGYSQATYNVTPRATTFAAPRVYDVTSANELDAITHNRYLNVMQVTDPVPASAPGWLGYKHLGSKMDLPYATNIMQHKMGGYQLALEGLIQAQDNTIKVGKTNFKFEESKRTGMGKSPTIGNTFIPNPLYPLHLAREYLASHVDPAIHRVVKSAKDFVVTGVKSVWTKAKNWFGK